MFGSPLITQTMFFRGFHRKTKRAVVFIKSDDESGDHGDEDRLGNHAIPLT
jgi:hypothetical protein